MTWLLLLSGVRVAVADGGAGSIQSPRECTSTSMPLMGRAGPGGTSQETGLRSHRHHQHHGPGAPGQLERHETPDPVRSSAVKPRIQCVRVWAQAQAQGQDRVHSRACSGRLLRSARGRPCVRSRVQARVRAWVHSCVRSSVRARPGRTPGSDQARHPRQQRSLGSERGLATPSPDGKGEIPLGPSMKIMPVDSYSTLGRSCEPAFKWIPDPGQAGSGRGLRGGVRRSRVAGPRWAATR
jgi:hypothetical protein